MTNIQTIHTKKPAIREKVILAHLTTTGTATVMEIARILKTTEATARVCLKTLFDQKKIHRVTLRGVDGGRRPLLYSLPRKTDAFSQGVGEDGTSNQDLFTSKFCFESEVTCHKCHRNFTGPAWINTVLDHRKKTFVSASLHCQECHQEEYPCPFD